MLHGQEPPAPQVYPHPIAFNVLGGAGNFADGDDHTDEERKMMYETRKILGDESIAHHRVTCARVPVVNCALGVGQRADARAARARARRASCCARRPGSTVVDDPARDGYPTALDAAGRDDVFVGRIRRDPSHERALDLWVVADNLRGAAEHDEVFVGRIRRDPSHPRALQPVGRLRQPAQGRRARTPCSWPSCCTSAGSPAPRRPGRVGRRGQLADRIPKAGYDLADPGNRACTSGKTPAGRA